MIFETNCYGLECDNCKKLFEDTSGFTIFVDKSGVLESSFNCNWVEFEGYYYCPDCATINDDDTKGYVQTIYFDEIVIKSKLKIHTFHAPKSQTAI